jgi:hypothetical protein
MEAEEDPLKTKEIPAREIPDFSLVLGGPLFQLYLRTRLSLDSLELLRRRILVITMIAWLPLLFLSALDGHLFGGSVRIPFLYDIVAQVRFLVALPFLILSEAVVHRRMSPVVRRFVERRIVVTEDLPRFRQAVDSAQRIRNSVALEVALLLLVYTLGIWTGRSQFATTGTTWYAADSSHFHLTSAGYWYTFWSIPIFQFMLLRWYVRILIWFRLLWQISRLNLHLSGAHPDRAGGIGFLRDSLFAFEPLLFAQGSMLSAFIANQILFEGKSLPSFKLDVAGSVALLMLCVLAPLIVFAPMLDRVKRRSSAEYGVLANRYVFAFEEKWIAGAAEETGELLGAADIQSLADLSNSFSVVREMRILPFTLGEVAWLAGATAAPLLPLTLTIFSLDELLTQAVKIVFG